MTGIPVTETETTTDVVSQLVQFWEGDSTTGHSTFGSWMEKYLETEKSILDSCKIDEHLQGIAE